MPAKTPATSPNTDAKLGALGERIRAQRKVLGVSAVAAAEAAGMSRVTWHRIEGGEPSVTMGAYLNAMMALGLDFGIVDAAPSLVAKNPLNESADGLPTRIRLSDYPQLKRLARQVHGVNELTAAEALGIYERNSRYLEPADLSVQEQHLLDALRRVLRGGGDVPA